MINKSLKYISLVFFFTLLIVVNTGCKKDKLKIDTTKNFYEINHISQNPFDNGWQLTLNPDGSADILPGGDIIYRGIYQIKGSKIKVKADQLTEEFEFKIITANEIKEVKYGTYLKLSI